MKGEERRMIRALVHGGWRSAAGTRRLGMHIQTYGDYDVIAKVIVSFVY
jgi:hypothetical protein